MDFAEYRVKGKEVVDYIADYLENIRERRVFPDVTPGYIRELQPCEAPDKGEEWDEIFKDVERVIMPGITHWQSPHMHAYFPALNSFPSLLGDMISDAINCLGFTWASSPACTELETLVMDWLVKCLGLPDKFLSSSQEPYGGGVLQTSVSESTYLALLAARTKMFHKYGCGEVEKYAEKSELNGRFVCYCSDQAHSSVEKSALVALTRIRLLPSDDKLSLRGETLKKAIEEDKEQGLIPFFVCATLGSTGACAFDNLEEIGAICQQEEIWLHVDAAYAGSAFFCEEFRQFYKGIEYATSFVFNPSKWLMVNFDCTCFWVESSIPLHQTFTVAPLYLKHKYSGAAVDYMHWQVGLSRRFRSLKLWFVLRSFGKQGIKAHIRAGVERAKLFEALVKADDRFEIIAERHLGLVVFRLKGKNEITELLLKQLNKDGRLHVVPASIKEKYIIRFTVTSFYTTDEDIKRDWSIIQSSADIVLKKAVVKHPLTIDTKIDEGFQSSLVLSNAPHTPKIVNASFVAFFPDGDLDLKYELAKEITSRSYDQSYLPLIPRKKAGIYSCSKGFSLDYLNSFTDSEAPMFMNRMHSDDNTSASRENQIGKLISSSDEALLNGRVANKPIQELIDEANGGVFGRKGSSPPQVIKRYPIVDNGHPAPVRYDNLNHKHFINKQASLDSKIQRIFEEAHDTETNPNQANNNEEPTAT